MVLEIDAQGSMNMTTQDASLNFTFSDYKTGSTTETIPVNYTLIGNDVGRLQDVVVLKMDQVLSGMDFQSRFDSYTNNTGNASLVAAQGGFVTLGTTDIGIADKQTLSGDGKILDGVMVLSYRAVATEDLAAGDHIAAVTVMFVDN